MGCVI